MSIAKKDVYDRAARAMFSLIKKCKARHLPIDLIIDMFDKTIIPILTYGCEVWGFGPNEIVNKFQRKFFKIVLNIRKSTPSAMIYGETGKYPLDITIKCRILNYWYKLVSHDNKHKLSSRIYKLLCTMYKAGLHECPYVKYIHKTLIEVGLPALWDTQDVTHINKQGFKSHIKQHTRDLYIQEWCNTLHSGSMYQNYRTFKTDFGQEAYMSLLPYNCVITILRFRTTNNNLPVNSQRFYEVSREERLCKKCNSLSVADEFHYLFVCDYFKCKREECLDRKYYTLPNTQKYRRLFKSTEKKELLKLKHFIDVICRSVNEL